jgi:hypothetical protein
MIAAIYTFKTKKKTHTIVFSINTLSLKITQVRNNTANIFNHQVYLLFTCFDIYVVL